MIIQRLFKKYQMPIDNIIFKEYRRLSLTQDEAWVLIELLKASITKDGFKKIKLVEQSEFSEEKIDKILHSLLKKGFILLKLVSDNKGKQKEVMDFENAFLKIENLLINDSKEEDLKINRSNIEDVVKRLEASFQKPLTSVELEIIKSWYGDKKYNQSDIIQMIEIVSKRTNPNIYKIDKELSLLENNFEIPKVDKKTEDEILKIFNAIKRW